jgi:hypothetical protein
MADFGRPPVLREREERRDPLVNEIHVFKRGVRSNQDVSDRQLDRLKRQLQHAAIESAHDVLYQP